MKIRVRCARSESESESESKMGALRFWSRAERGLDADAGSALGPTAWAGWR